MKLLGLDPTKLLGDSCGVSSSGPKLQSTQFGDVRDQVPVLVAFFPGPGPETAVFIASARPRSGTRNWKGNSKTPMVTSRDCITFWWFPKMGVPTLNRLNGIFHDKNHPFVGTQI